MTWLRRFWRWLKDKVTGRRYYIGVDPSGPNGDFSAVVCAYRRRDGVVVITGVHTWRDKGAGRGAV